jgi:pimeloyl-ACP methyl ester carboxylesterase
MPIIDMEGVHHVYELTPKPQSSSPTLIFIHGWLLSRNYWQPLVRLLEPEYQCLVYDLRGFGESQRTPSPSGKNNSSYTLASYAQDLNVLLEKLGIERAWLLGHSLGGSIALWGAKIFPQQVQGVICLNAGGGIYLKEEFDRFRSVGQKLIEFRPPWLSSVPLIELVFARAMVARPLDIHWGRQRVIDFLAADGEAAMGSLLESTTEKEVHRLPQIVSCLSQPIYFISGREDKIMEPKHVRHLASFHPLFSRDGGNVVEIPNCGHLSMLEQTEIVNSKILDILNQH